MAVFVQAFLLTVYGDFSLAVEYDSSHTDLVSVDEVIVKSWIELFHAVQTSVVTAFECSKGSLTMQTIAMLRSLRSR